MQHDILNKWSNGVPLFGTPIVGIYIKYTLRIHITKYTLRIYIYIYIYIYTLNQRILKSIQLYKNIF